MMWGMRHKLHRNCGRMRDKAIAELVDKAMSVNGVQSKSAPWAGMARS